jgi:nucleotide-binding universal stress UspA family protein
MYSHILVPLDGSATAQRGLEQAIRLATGQHSALVLLHVIADFPRMRDIASTASLEALEADRRSQAQALLDAGARLAHDQGVKADTRVVLATEDVPQTILDTARERACDLIVIGSHGRSGFRRAVLGSVAEGVSRNSPVPVLLVPPGPAA